MLRLNLGGSVCPSSVTAPAEGALHLMDTSSPVSIRRLPYFSLTLAQAGRVGSSEHFPGGTIPFCIISERCYRTDMPRITERGGGLQVTCSEYMGEQHGYDVSRAAAGQNSAPRLPDGVS